MYLISERLDVRVNIRGGNRNGNNRLSKSSMLKSFRHGRRFF